jgi:dihydroorotate dehydrogenase
LRDLQFGEQLDQLLKAITDRRTELADERGRRVPLAVKIAPDMDQFTLKSVADILMERGIDAVIATNTTVDKSSVTAFTHGEEQGGLSGGPLTHASTDIIFALNEVLQGALPIIGVGGILSPRDARAKIEAGASLVQVYTGFIYRGPKLVRECALELAKR